ncbi:hypothetical protein MRBLMN1_004528 [Chitinophaga ginsengisegetis]|uniref:hypothetical protein n=1 Tax=Chitinophaga ginsengisegetis TaxID=393003 RepID=UPI00341656FC
MKYLNPFAFLEKMNGGPVSAENAAAVSLLRKKMMAELELSEEKVLRVGAQWFSKNDLLLFFDELQSPGKLHLHQQINEDNVLSAFLETGKLTGLFNNNPLYSTPVFLTFIAPFYEPVFTTAVLNSLKQQQAAALQQLYANPLLMDGEHLNRSYDKIFRALQESYKILEAAEKGRRADPGSRWREAAPYVSLQQVQTLNALPDIFQEFRNDYGILMINFALALDGTRENKKALEILHAVNTLKCGAYVREETHRYLQQLEEKAASRKSLLGRFFGNGYKTRQQRRKLVRDVLLKGGIALGIIVAIFIGARFEQEYTPRIKVRESEHSIFMGARTSLTMQYLLSQLLMDTEKRAKKLLKSPKLPSPATGADVYGADFMKAVRMQGDYGAGFLRPPFGRSREWGPEDSSWHDAAHRQSMQVVNRQDGALITMVQTPDSFYSCYIAPFDSAFVPLPLSISRVYFYAGVGWDPDWKAEYAMEYVPSYRAKGFFLMPVYDALSFLKTSCLQLNLDSSYWQHSNRYIPVEVFLSQKNQLQQELQLRQLTNNFNGVDLIPVE